MAYASIAGVPAQFGLYSVPLAVVAYAWLGSSQRLFVGPSSLAVLRMGFVSRLFAEPVLDGFIIGLGVYVLVGQLPKLVGMEKPEGSTLKQLWEVATSVSSWNSATVAVGVCSLAALLLLHRLAPRVPPRCWSSRSPCCWCRRCRWRTRVSRSWARSRRVSRSCRGPR
jgi:MFS superfamily sulfate permease-like transporter